MSPPTLVQLPPRRSRKARSTANSRAPKRKRHRQRKPPRAAQLRLPVRGRGGSRPGAGRPKKAGSGVPHLRRAKLSRHHPVHVSWRLDSALPSLRRPRLMRALERAFEKGCQRFGMRLVHYSVQPKHMHLICEADDERALSRGLQGLGIRLAKALNRALGRKGKVFADRFHCTVLSSPRQVRNALRYVLGNLRRHAWQRAELLPDGALDPCSSARFFDGYRGRDKTLVVEAWMEPQVPVAPPRCWLLTKGWRRSGLLCIDDIPGS